MAEIVLDGVGKRFADGTRALEPTSLAIGDGELFVLVGPSGCGKSTLLKLLVGLERPTEGEIRVDGVPVTDLDPKDRNMAMVFQSYALYPHLTVRENLAFPLKLARLARDEIDRRVAEAATMLGIGDLLGRRPAALSGGQRQRVAMGRAMVRRPAAFLLDEPLSNLDARLRVQMRGELAALQRRLKTTMVYVTHDQTEAMTLGERIAVLREGAVQQVGSPRELYRSPANLFVAGFLGSPPIDAVPARIEGGRLILPMGALDLPASYRRPLAQLEQVVVGIRPEAIREAIGTSGPDSLDFRVTPQSVEWLGADLFVRFEVDPQFGSRPAAVTALGDPGSADEAPPSLVARIGADRRIQPGEPLDLFLDAADLLLFHPETGERIIGSA